MNIQLNHFKTRGVFDVTTKLYEDISFIQNTEQVHTHNHIYLFVTPQMSLKLDGIEPGSLVNIIETIKIDGTALPVTNKEIDIPVATSTTTGMMTPEDKLKLESFEDKEFVISAALNDLNSKFSTIDNKIENVITDNDNKIETIITTCEENELVTSAALNDLYQMIQNLSASGGTNPFEGYNILVINSINEFTSNVDPNTPPTLFLVVPSTSNNGGDRGTPGVVTNIYETGIIPYGGGGTTYFYSNSGKIKLVYFETTTTKSVTSGWYPCLDPINIEFRGIFTSDGDIDNISAISANIIDLLLGYDIPSLINNVNINSTVKFILDNDTIKYIPADISFNKPKNKLLIAFNVVYEAHTYNHSIIISSGQTVNYDGSIYDELTKSGDYYNLATIKSSEPNEK